MKTLILNKIKCNHCNDEITSYSQHDFQMCSCKRVGIDGGLSYRRFTGKDENYTDLAVYSDEPFEKVRESCYRTGYGKVGTPDYGTHRITFLKNMTDGHLNALLDYCGGNHIYLPIYKQEIEYRKEKGIKIDD